MTATSSGASAACHAREWSVLIEQHHEGYIDWSTYEANQLRLGTNTRPQPHQAGGAVREGAALLQGLATCGHCGRKLRTHYRGKHQAPGYHCSNKDIVNGRGVYCLNVGGVQIDRGRGRGFPGRGRAGRLERRIARGRAAASRSRRRAGPVAPGGRARASTRPSAPSAAIARSIPTTDWSHAGSKRAMGAVSARPRAGARRADAPTSSFARTR